MWETYGFPRVAMLKTRRVKTIKMEKVIMAWKVLTRAVVRNTSLGTGLSKGATPPMDWGRW